MSAYMVSKEHIDALVATALYGPKESNRRDWDAPTFGATRRPVAGNENEVGDMLVRENLSSIHERYPDTIENPDDTPGPCDNYWAREYTFPNALHYARKLTAVEALKAIRCYEYQSCEHPEWEDSDAKKFCTSLTECLISELPGYSNAAWEITKPLAAL